MGEPRVIMEIQVETGRDRWVKGLDLDLLDHVGNQSVTQRGITLGSLVIGLLRTWWLNQV